MRRAARKDDSHKAIVEGLEAHGIVVFDVSSLSGLGFDIVCYDPSQVWEIGSQVHEGIYKIFEIKNPEPATRVYKSSKRNLQPKETRQLTASEIKARSKAPIPCIRTIEEALSYF